MTEPTDKQLNEWCGTKGINYYEGDTALGFLFKYAVPKLKVKYRNWKSVLHDWVDELTGDYEKDAIALFNVLDEIREAESGQD